MAISVTFPFPFCSSTADRDSLRRRLNQAIDFIEENLDGELDYEEVARIAGCPSYYFQQMFLYMTDMTLREYNRFIQSIVFPPAVLNIADSLTKNLAFEQYELIANLCKIIFNKTGNSVSGFCLFKRIMKSQNLRNESYCNIFPL